MAARAAGQGRGKVRPVTSQPGQKRRRHPNPGPAADPSASWGASPPLVTEAGLGGVRLHRRVGGRERTAGSGVCLSKVSLRLRLSWSLPLAAGRRALRPSAPACPRSSLPRRAAVSWALPSWLLALRPASPYGQRSSQTIVALALDGRFRTWEPIGLLLPLTYGREAWCLGSVVLIRAGTTVSSCPRAVLPCARPRRVAEPPAAPSSRFPRPIVQRRPFLRFCAPSMPGRWSAPSTVPTPSRSTWPRPARPAKGGCGGRCLVCVPTLVGLVPSRLHRWDLPLQRSVHILSRTPLGWPCPSFPLAVQNIRPLATRRIEVRRPRSRTRAPLALVPCGKPRQAVREVVGSATNRPQWRSQRPSGEGLAGRSQSARSLTTSRRRLPDRPSLASEKAWEKHDLPAPRRPVQVPDLR